MEWWNELEALKEELNELIANQGNAEEIYELSLKIDKYIVEYYKDGIREV